MLFLLPVVIGDMRSVLVPIRYTDSMSSIPYSAIMFLFGATVMLWMSFVTLTNIAHREICTPE